MANFELSLCITLNHEGGYVNDHDDPGAETYKGISRRYNPNWDGWKIIDKSKMYASFPHCLDQDQVLQDSIKWLYRHNYWNKILGDKINNQWIANVFFDSVVNPGFIAIKLMQEAINDFIHCNKLDVDGTVGNNTLREINSIDNICSFLKLFESYRIEYYEKHSKDKYINGLINRATSWQQMMK